MAAPSPEELRREFLLDPEIAFLNHGSFGACPRVVFESYQTWQHELEHEPVDFLARRLPDLLDAARSTSPPISVAPRWTSPSSRTPRQVSTSPPGRSLSARTTRCSRPPSSTERATSRGSGPAAAPGRTTSGRRSRFPFPTRVRSSARSSPGERAHAGRLRKPRHVHDRARPAGGGDRRVRPGAGPRHGRRRRARACPGAARPRRARRRLLRGERAQVARRAERRRLPARAARAPGPSRRRHRQLGLHRRDSFSERIEIQGTRDPAAWLAVPDAIRFQAERDWDAVRDRSRRLTRSARRELCELVGQNRSRPSRCSRRWRRSGCPAPRPTCPDGLFARHRVEIPVGGEEEDVLRLSVAAYTTRAEIDRLLAALVRELDAEHRQDDE